MLMREQSVSFRMLLIAVAAISPLVFVFFPGLDPALYLGVVVLAAALLIAASLLPGGVSGRCYLRLAIQGLAVSPADPSAGGAYGGRLYPSFSSNRPALLPDPWA